MPGDARGAVHRALAALDFAFEDPAHDIVGIIAVDLPVQRVVTKTSGFAEGSGKGVIPSPVPRLVIAHKARSFDHDDASLSPVSETASITAISAVDAALTVKCIRRPIEAVQGQS
jgi:hypothetical protein